MKARILLALAIGASLAVVSALTSSVQGARITPPVLVGHSPAANSFDASPRTSVLALFNQPMDPASVSSATFVIRSAQRGFVAGSYLVAGGSVSFVPSAPMQWGEPLYATATRGLLNLAGEPPTVPTVWQFQTDVRNGSAQFVLHAQIFPEIRTHDVALGDLDADGDLDAFTGQADSPNHVWFNNGSGLFVDSGQMLGDTLTEAVAVGDLDGDGDLDAFVANRYSYRSDQIWLNDGLGYFMDSGQTLGNEESGDVALGDLDGDGDLDAMVVSWGTDPMRVWLNNGSAEFTDNGQLLGQANGIKVALGDLDGDGDLDAVVGNYGTPSKVYLNGGNAQFSEHPFDDSWVTGLALGDLDGDGDLDAFVGKSDPDRVFFNNGEGVFAPSFQLLGNNYSKGVVLGDLDADGDLDAYTAGVYPDLVWLNDGTGYFSPGVPVGVDSYSAELAIGDLDGDADLDVFVANGIALGHNEVWLNQNRPIPCWPCWRPFEGRPPLR